MNILEKFEGAPYELEDLKIPKTKLKFNDEGTSTFNSIYKWCQKNIEQYGIERTDKGYISRKANANKFPAYDIQMRRTLTGRVISIELTVITDKSYRFVVSGTFHNSDDVTGSEAFLNFKRACKRHGVNLEDFAIPNGKEVKADIPEPMISYDESIKDQTIEHAHHLDLNSSYMAGIARYTPQLYPVIKEIYDARKFDKKCKDILTHSYGFMQSPYCHFNGHGYSLANLSLQAHQYNNNALNWLTGELKKNGNKILAYNTDGIWYTGELLHNSLEGKDLGQYKNDEIDCTIRFKSKGCYEFKRPDGSYKPVVRGLTRRDFLIDRDSWEWGDIYQEDCKVIAYSWKEEEGIIAYEVQDE